MRPYAFLELQTGGLPSCLDPQNDIARINGTSTDGASFQVEDVAVGSTSNSEAWSK